MLSRSFKIDQSSSLQFAPANLEANSLVFFFSNNHYETLNNHYNLLKNTYPKATILGCSAGFQIFEDEINSNETSVLALTFENSSFKVVQQSCVGQNSFSVGQAIGKALNAKDLRGLFMLTDGLSLNGSQLIDGLQTILDKNIPITGGMAGDGAEFVKTYVVANSTPQSGIVAAVGFYGEALSLKTGSGGGWSEFGPKRLITKSEDNLLLELDGKPALELYEKYLGEEAEGLPSSGLLFPLKIIDPNTQKHDMVRTILSIDRTQKSMTFAGTMPQGWSAQLMRGSFENLIEASRAAALVAKQEGTSAVIAVSCIGRKLLLGQKTVEEVIEVKQVLGAQTPLIGFYSYGEFSPHHHTGLSDLHNQTLTLLSFKEKTSA